MPSPFGDASPTSAIRPSSISTSPRTIRPSTRAEWTPRLIRADPGAQRDDRDLRAAVRGGKRFLDLVGRGAGGGADDPADPRPKLLVRRGDVDHERAVRLPEPDHGQGRERVEDELLRRTRLEARGAGEEL